MNYQGDLHLQKQNSIQTIPVFQIEDPKKSDLGFTAGKEQTSKDKDLITWYYGKSYAACSKKPPKTRAYFLGTQRHTCHQRDTAFQTACPSSSTKEKNHLQL